MAIHGPLEFADLRQFNLAEKVSTAAFTIAISDFGRSQLMAVAERDRWRDIHVVRCGLELDRFAVDRHGAQRELDEPHILSVGRLIHIKGQALLIEAIAQLSARGVAARLTLVGDGPTRAELERLTERLGVADRVTFTGAVGQDHIQSIYRSADVFCLPSMAEGLPVVFMEAMALRLPVVATRIMGVPELVEDGKTGLLVAPGRVDLLAGALERLIADPGLRSTLGRQGREKVLAEFDVDSSARRLRDIFGAVAAEPR
jgi:glycosyltransferase involved in cell wall biosynthesis